MKKIIVICLTLIVALNANAQKINPVKWTYEAVKKADKQYEIVFTASIDAPWHIYSMFVNKGPVPTKISFKKNALLQLKGKIREIGKVEKQFDKNFGVEIATFSGKVQYLQNVSLRASGKTSIAGEIEYMACNDNRCLPSAKVPFEVVIQ